MKTKLVWRGFASQPWFTALSTAFPRARWTIDTGGHKRPVLVLAGGKDETLKQRVRHHIPTGWTLFELPTATEGGWTLYGALSLDLAELPLVEVAKKVRSQKASIAGLQLPDHVALGVLGADWVPVLASCRTEKYRRKAALALCRAPKAQLDALCAAQLLAGDEHMRKFLGQILREMKSK